MKIRAKQIIKEELKKRGITYIKLSILMKERGYEYSDNTIRSKINRGSYSFSFLLEVCDALNITLEFKPLP
jgi:ribose 5-phosphate isomerase RpiB